MGKCFKGGEGKGKYSGFRREFEPGFGIRIRKRVIFIKNRAVGVIEKRGIV